MQKISDIINKQIIGDVVAMEKVSNFIQPIKADPYSTMTTKYNKQESMNSVEVKNQRIEKEDMEKAVSAWNEFIQPVRRNIKFEFHEKLEQYYVTVVDSDTDQVIREIPQKKFLDMYAEMADFMGFLIDKKV